jgi:hypothetical protein
VSSYRSLAPEIERIRARLLAMRTEREAAMNRLAESREHAEAQRHERNDDTAARPSQSQSPSPYAP